MVPAEDDETVKVAPGIQWEGSQKKVVNAFQFSWLSGERVNIVSFQKVISAD